MGKINLWCRVAQAALLFLCFLRSSSGVHSISDASKYLSKYGYLQEKSNRLMDEKVLKRALEDYQKFMGIRVSGTLCNTTLKMMNAPRCGVKDVHNRNSSKYVARSRWETKRLTYRIKNYPSNLSQRDVDATIQTAFDIWAKYTDLTFTHVRNNVKVHIDITFSVIDGPGQVLAQAYFPPGGNAQFDSYEQWTINGYQGYSLLQVAAHEFGHSLGLDHSNIYAALMWPSYKSSPNLDLDHDDINGIQYLYGRKIVETTTTTKPHNQPEWPAPEDKPNNICKDPVLDTIFTMAGDTIAFKGSYYWYIVNYKIQKGYPRLISEKWAGLPGDIDAAFTSNSGQSTYFFKGELCWKYSAGSRIFDGFPKMISEEFPGIPNELDAAMVWRNGLIYFFKGAKFWKYSEVTKRAIAFNISDLRGIPNDLSAAFRHTNGNTYFFKGTEYYRFNEMWFSVVYEYPFFPRPTATWWLGCSSSEATDRTSNAIDFYF